MEIHTKVYFDTEFTDLKKDADLISIGMVHIDPYHNESQALYLEITDYDRSKASHWVEENVIKNLVLTKENPPVSTNNYMVAKCDKITARNLIFNWLKGGYEDLKLNMLEENQIQLVGDVCHYDFMLFLDLFGTALDAPDFISPVCLDMNNRIAEFCAITPSKAFDKSREEMIQMLDSLFKLYNASPMFDCYNNRIPRAMRKQHNALYEAFILNKLDSYMDDAEQLIRVFN